MSSPVDANGAAKRIGLLFRAGSSWPPIVKIDEEHQSLRYLTSCRATHGSSYLEKRWFVGRIIPSHYLESKMHRFFIYNTTLENNLNAKGCRKWRGSDEGKEKKHRLPFVDQWLEKKFRDQSIDGATLPLLTEDHLTSYLGLKLGPALKLRSTLARRIGHCAVCMHCIHCHGCATEDSSSNIDIVNRRHDSSSRSPSTVSK